MRGRRLARAGLARERTAQPSLSRSVLSRDEPLNSDSSNPTQLRVESFVLNGAGLPLTPALCPNPSRKPGGTDMRPSSSVTELPSLGAGNAVGGGTSRAAAHRREMSRLNGASSAPSLHGINQRARDMRDSVERVVTKLTERPGIAPLLLLHEQEHAAGVLKALRPERRPTQGPPAPRLLAQPPIKMGMLNSLARRSQVLSQIADELGAAHSAAHTDSYFLDGGEDTAAGEGHADGFTSRMQPAGWGAPSSAFMATHDPLSQKHPLRQPMKHSGSRAGSRQSSRDGLPMRSSSRRASTPATGMLLGSASSSSLHAARAEAARSAAQLDTKIEHYLTQYRLSQRMDTATTQIQSAWRGRTSRNEVSSIVDSKRAFGRQVFQAWYNVAAAQRHARFSTLERAFFGWLREQREARGAISKLAFLLHRSIGSSPAFAYWRIVIDKRKRRPPAPDCPTIEAALGRCLLMLFMRKILHEWRRHVKVAWVLREKAATKIQSAARPMHLWPSEVLALALTLWSRIAKYHSCQRRGVPPPVYLRYVPQWHEVMHFPPRPFRASFP